MKKFTLVVLLFLGDIYCSGRLEDKVATVGQGQTEYQGAATQFQVSITEQEKFQKQVSFVTESVKITRGIAENIIFSNRILLISSIPMAFQLFYNAARNFPPEFLKNLTQNMSSCLDTNTNGITDTIIYSTETTATIITGASSNDLMKNILFMPPLLYCDLDLNCEIYDLYCRDYRQHEYGGFLDSASIYSRYCTGDLFFYDSITNTIKDCEKYKLGYTKKDEVCLSGIYLKTNYPERFDIFIGGTLLINPSANISRVSCVQDGANYRCEASSSIDCQFTCDSKALSKCTWTKGADGLADQRGYLSELTYYTSDTTSFVDFKIRETYYYDYYIPIVSFNEKIVYSDGKTDYIICKESTYGQKCSIGDYMCVDTGHDKSVYVVKYGKDYIYSEVPSYGGSESKEGKVKICAEADVNFSSCSFDSIFCDNSYDISVKTEYNSDVIYKVEFKDLFTATTGTIKIELPPIVEGAKISSIVSKPIKGDVNLVNVTGKTKGYRTSMYFKLYDENRDVICSGDVDFNREIECSK